MLHRELFRSLSGNERPNMGLTFTNIAWSGSKWVIVAFPTFAARVPVITFSSSDADTWVANYSLTPYDGNDCKVYWGNNNFIVPFLRYNNPAFKHVAYSPDGNTWATTTMVSRGAEYNYIWDGTKWISSGFVTSGSPPIVTPSWRTSTDNITWTSYNPGFVASTIEYNGTLWCSNNISGPPLGSTDGLTWSIIGNWGASGFSAHKIISNASMFVAIGSNSTIRTSTNITTWTGRTTPVTHTGSPIDGLWDGTHFRFLCRKGSGAYYFLNSTDGITWTQDADFTALSAVYATSLGYGGGKWVIVSNLTLSPFTGQVWTSTDRITWTRTL